MRKIMRKKEYSLIELVVSIIIIPIVVGIITSLYFYTSRVSNFATSNSKMYADISQSINQLNIDSSTCYDFKVENDKLTLYNSEGTIEYEYKDDGLYRNDYKYASIESLDIEDITTTDNLYPLYEVTFHSNINIENQSSPFEIKTKLTFPIKQN